MNIQEKKLENSRMELTIEVPAQRIDTEYENVFAKIQKKAKVDGFRPGKAPLAMVKNKYKDHAEQDVVENIVKDTYLEAVKEKNHHPISYPTFDFQKLEQGQNFTFKAVFDVPPTIGLGSYKGIAVEERSCNVSDLDVMEEIESLREQHAVISAKEDGKAVEKGDIAKIKIKRVDNLAPEAVEAAEYRDVTVIAGQRDDDFEFDAYVVGLNKDEEKEVTFTYPEDYQYKSVAGQTQTYKVKVAEIQKRDLPAVDDDFAKDTGTYESAADMKAKIRESLEKLVSQKGRGEAKGEILKKIVEASTYDIPASMIEEELGMVFDRLCQRIGYRVETPEQLAPFFGMKGEELSAKLREEAVQSIKTSLAVGEITKKEGLTVSDEQFRNSVKEMSVGMKKTEEEVFALIEKSNARARVESEILYDATVDFVYAEAKVKKLAPVALKEFVKN